MSAFRTAQQLVALPRAFVPDAVAGLNVQTEEGCAAARLRLATDLARSLKASTLISACRALGIRHVTQGHQAAHALAAATIPTATVESPCKWCGAEVGLGEPDGGLDERLCLRCWREDNSPIPETPADVEH